MLLAVQRSPYGYDMTTVATEDWLTPSAACLEEVGAIRDGQEGTQRILDTHSSTADTGKGKMDTCDRQHDDRAGRRGEIDAYKSYWGDMDRRETDFYPRGVPHCRDKAMEFVGPTPARNMRPRCRGSGCEQIRPDVYVVPGDMPGEKAKDREIACKKACRIHRKEKSTQNIDNRARGGHRPPNFFWTLLGKQCQCSSVPHNIIDGEFHKRHRAWTTFADARGNRTGSTCITDEELAAK